MGAEEAGSRERKKTSGSGRRKRSGIIGIRVSAAERAEIERSAERLELSVGSYIRSRVLKAPQTRAVKKPAADRVMLAKLLGQIGKTGGNIHQIVKRMNFGYGVEHDALLSALADFRACVSDIMKALGREPL